MLTPQTVHLLFTPQLIATLQRCHVQRSRTRPSADRGGRTSREHPPPPQAHRTQVPEAAPRWGRGAGAGCPPSPRHPEPAASAVEPAPTPVGFYSGSLYYFPLTVMKAYLCQKSGFLNRSV